MRAQLAEYYKSAQLAYLMHQEILISVYVWTAPLSSNALARYLKMLKQK